MDRRTDTWMAGWTDRQTDGQADKQPGRWTDCDLNIYAEDLKMFLNKVKHVVYPTREIKSNLKSNNMSLHGRNLSK